MTKTKAANAITGVVRDIVKEMGSVPSGHLYAILMGMLTLDEYQAIVASLVDKGDVTLSGNHLLSWEGK